MSIRVTEADIRREEHAHKLNATLVGTAIHAVAGGSKGPYTLVVERLNREELIALVAAVRAATGR